MAPKITPKVAEKVFPIFQPQLDALDEVRDVFKGAKTKEGKPFFLFSNKEQRHRYRSSLRKMEKSIDVLRKVFTMKKAGEKKIKDGHQKSKHISDWHSARKIVNNEIANTAMVKKMVKGSPYYGLVKAKLDELVKAKLGLGQ